MLVGRDLRDVAISSYDLIGRSLMAFPGGKLLRDEAWVLTLLAYDMHELQSLAKLPHMHLRYEDFVAEVSARDVPVMWGNRADACNLAPMVLHPFRDGLDGGSFIVKDSFDDAAIVNGLEVGNDDVMVDKYRMSGFWDTQFDSILRNPDARTLPFAGVNLDPVRLSRR